MTRQAQLQASCHIASRGNRVNSFLPKKNPKDNMPIRKTIPSWCRCDASQKCVLVEYDRRKKMDVHKCQDAEQQPISIRVRHLRSRGGGEQWVFDVPVHRNNQRRNQQQDIEEINDSIES